MNSIVRNAMTMCEFCIQNFNRNIELSIFGHSNYQCTEKCKILYHILIYSKYLKRKEFFYSNTFQCCGFRHGIFITEL